ncbi:hypothetical protein R1flu_014804 [Riccia fluitans]|uniref:PIN domain-containing protein n=1 Tax=Riccia fluitans TaxID=41844 RepID=A0ABD1YHF4_9MARC
MDNVQEMGQIRFLLDSNWCAETCHLIITSQIHEEELRPHFRIYQVPLLSFMEAKQLFLSHSNTLSQRFSRSVQSFGENHLQQNTAIAPTYNVTPASIVTPVPQSMEGSSQKKRRAGKEPARGKNSLKSSGPKSTRAKGTKKVTVDLEADSDSSTFDSDADDGADELFDNRAAVQKQVHVDARGSSNPSQVEFNIETRLGEETCAKKYSFGGKGSTPNESNLGYGENHPNVTEASSQSTIKPRVFSQKNERRRSVGEKLCVLLENMVDNSTKIVENSSKMSQHIEKSLVFFEKLDEHMANLIAKI